MLPLQSVAMGLLVVAITARFGEVDVLADPLGWVLVAIGVSAVAGLPDRPGVLGAVGLAGVVSIALWLPSVRQALDDDALRWAANLPQVVAVALIARALSRAARDDPSARLWWQTSLVLVVAVGLMPVLVFGGGVTALEQASYVGAGLTLLLVVVLLFAHARRPWARPAPPVA